MKRIFAILLAVCMLAALLCACGDDEKKSGTDTVTTTVKAQYADDVAGKYAKAATVDEAGNEVYEFTEEQYQRYTKAHDNTLEAELMTFVAGNHPDGFGPFVSIDQEKQAVLIGTFEGMYDAKIAEKEAPEVAKYGFRFFQNLQAPVDTIRVVYIDANDPTHNTEYASFEFTAE